MNVQDEDETDFDCRRSKGQRELEDDFKKAKKRFPKLLSLKTPITDLHTQAGHDGQHRRAGGHCDHGPHGPHHRHTQGHNIDLPGSGWFYPLSISDKIKVKRL